MSVTELLSLADAGKADAFEARCMELLENGQLRLGDLATSLQRLQKAGKPERVGPLARMVLDVSGGGDEDPAGEMRVVRLALETDPNNVDLRKRFVDLCERVHGDAPGFRAILEASGLRVGRPLRAALRVLDVCLNLTQGDTLLSRTDSHAVEVTEIDHSGGLYTLRREGRHRTIPATELAKEYDRVARDDFRVLRQLWPDRLNELVESNPVALVIGLIHAHGEMIDVDGLKRELVPRYLPASNWAKWWTAARNLLKRSPNVIMEGRSPIVLKYTAAGQTLEDETWQAITKQREPVEWLESVAAYCREKAKWKEPPDAAFLERIHHHLVGHIHTVQARRPIEALAAALALHRLVASGLPATDETRGLAVAMLRENDEPAKLIGALDETVLWEEALAVLPEARPDDATPIMVALLPMAPASVLDDICEHALAHGASASVQAFIDAALRDPVHHAEMLYWLWRGPSKADGLQLPPTRELFVRILDTLTALGRSLTPSVAVMKHFRARLKAALALRDYGNVRAVFAQTSAGQAITMRSQLDRLDGLGENTPAALLDLLRDVHPELWVKQEKYVAPWEDPDAILSTPQGIRRKTEERDDLVNVQMRDNARRIGEAAALGDLSENSEYKFALEERDLLRARLAQMNNDLARARELRFHDVPSDHVGIGSHVTARDVVTGESRSMTFLGPFDTDVERNVYNYRAPLSQKFMGARLGDHVRITVDGREAELEVVAIENGLRTLNG